MSVRPALVITTCGKSKLPHAAPAGEFYTGSFVKAQKDTAKALHPRIGWIVLSNVYGFMDPYHDEVPGPYDSHWGYEDTAKDKVLQKQVLKWEKNLKAGDIIYCLGGEDYVKQVRRFFPETVRVLCSSTPF